MAGTFLRQWCIEKPENEAAKLLHSSIKSAMYCMRLLNVGKRYIILNNAYLNVD